MNRTLRLLAIVAGVLILLALVVPFLIPVNQFRPTIEQKASAALGRNVQVGTLHLSLFSGSLAADNLSIGDDPKFNSSEFLTAKSVKVGVELMPLILSKDLRITNISIDSPQVILLRNPAGQWNYSSLGASAAKSQGNKPPETPRPQQPASAGEQFSIQKLELKNGRIVVGSTVSRKRSAYDNVTVLASGVSPTSQFPVQASADLPGGGKLKLEGTLGPLDSTDTALTPVRAKLSVSSLNLAATGFLDPPAGLGGLLDLDATLESQNGEAQLQGTAKLSKALLVAGGSPAAMPVTVDLRTKYNLRKNAGVLEPSTLKIGRAAAHVYGTYQVEADTTVVNLKVEGQNLPAKDLQTFLPALAIHMPNGASLESGTLNANLTISGPTNRLVTTGNVGAFGAKLAGFDLGSKLKTVSSLIGVQTGRDLEIERLTSNLRVAPDGIKVDNLIAVVPALGTLTGTGAIDAKNRLDFKMAATLSKPLRGAAGAATDAATGALGSLLGKVTGNAAPNTAGCKSSGGPAVAFQIQGTTKDPKFIPDVGGAAASVLKAQLGCSNPAAPGAAQTPKFQNNPADSNNPANPIDTLRDLSKKKKP
jgi:AsmA protein